MHETMHDRGGLRRPGRGPSSQNKPRPDKEKSTGKASRHKIKTRNTDPRSRSSACRSRCRNQRSRSPEYALDEMFTITELGISGELARSLSTTNVIESPNSVVRRVSGRVTNYKSADMALRWTAAGFLEAQKSFRKLRGHAQMNSLINALRPKVQSVKKAA